MVPEYPGIDQSHFHFASLPFLHLLFAPCYIKNRRRLPTGGAKHMVWHPASIRVMDLRPGLTFRNQFYAAGFANKCKSHVHHPKRNSAPVVRNFLNEDFLGHQSLLIFLRYLKDRILIIKITHFLNFVKHR